MDRPAMYVIYNPTTSDQTGKWIVRSWYKIAGFENFVPAAAHLAAVDTLEEARAVLPPEGYVLVPPVSQDDPTIQEMWLLRLDQSDLDKLEVEVRTEKAALAEAVLFIKESTQEYEDLKRFWNSNFKVQAADPKKIKIKAVEHYLGIVKRDYAAREAVLASFQATLVAHGIDI